MRQDAVILVIISIAIYIMGFTSGYVVSIWAMDTSQKEIQRAVALLITLLWVFSLVISWVNPDYQTSVFVHGVMGLAAGFLLPGDGSLRIPISIGGGEK